MWFLKKMWIQTIPVQTTIHINEQQDKDMYNDVKRTHGKDGDINT